MVVDVTVAAVVVSNGATGVTVVVELFATMIILFDTVGCGCL